MGLLGKYAAYRWMSSGRGDGDDDGSTGLAIIFGILAAIIGVFWVVYVIFSSAWSLVYGVVRPVLMVYPPVTVPIAVAVLGWAFTWIGPYPTEKTEALLNGTGDRLSFAARTVWAVTLVNVFFLLPLTGTLPEPRGFVNVVFGLVIVLPVLLFGLYELFHTPYRCIRLLLHASNGTRYVIAFLSPMLFILLTATFDVSLGIPLSSPVSLDSEVAVVIAALTVLNATYLGGSLAVLWKQDSIRVHGITADQEGDRRKPSFYTTSTAESTSNTD